MLSEGQIKKVYLSVFLPLFSPRLTLQKEFKIVQKFQFKPKTESAFSSLHVKKTIGKGGFAPPRRYQISPRPETCIMKLDQHVGSLGLILVLQGNGCDKGGLSASIRGLSDAATGIHTFKRRKLNSLTDATGTNEDYLSQNRQQRYCSVLEKEPHRWKLHFCVSWI